MGPNIRFAKEIREKINEKVHVVDPNDTDAVIRMDRAQLSELEMDVESTVNAVDQLFGQHRGGEGQEEDLGNEDGREESHATEDDEVTYVARGVHRTPTSVKEESVEPVFNGSGRREQRRRTQDTLGNIASMFDPAAQAQKHNETGVRQLYLQQIADLQKQLRGKEGKIDEMRDTIRRLTEEKYDLKRDVDQLKNKQEMRDMMAEMVRHEHGRGRSPISHRDYNRSSSHRDRDRSYHDRRSASPKPRARLSPSAPYTPHRGRSPSASPSSRRLADNGTHTVRAGGYNIEISPPKGKTRTISLAISPRKAAAHSPEQFLDEEDWPPSPTRNGHGISRPEFEEGSSNGRG